MGVAGVLTPDRQVRLMGFTGSRTARHLLTVSSLAAVNTGLLNLLGAAKGWPGFPAFTVRARLLMGGGLVALAGAVVTAAALGRERKRAAWRLSTRS
ncbi:hypothetical protein AB0C38_28810 [Amycolatopsis sp. NPDC048633]|uniref:hypothetical protein n=1 Tax=Amycolatopsis sp. NPDC048633 TaxID=3157095 RepID=UPI0033D3F5A3